jgi:hypothetical protein
MKNGPEIFGAVREPVCCIRCALVSATSYFFFFAGAFFVADFFAAFLVAFFIE